MRMRYELQVDGERNRGTDGEDEIWIEGGGRERKGQRKRMRHE